jgi:hypothetical protein
MSGNGIHVESFETDVMGIFARPEGVVTRCVSVADTSLSLSLSLSAANLVAGKTPVSALLVAPVIAF